MKCKICGSELEPGATSCHVCGIAIDTHDYVNNPFSKEEQTENNLQKSSFFSQPTNNENKQIDSENFFFNNKNKTSTTSNGFTEIKPIYILIGILIIVAMISSGILLSKVIYSEEKPHSGEGEIIFGSGDTTENPTEPSSGEEDPTEPSSGEEPSQGENPSTGSDPNTGTENPPEDDTNYTPFYGYKFKIPNGYDPTIEQEYMTLINQKNRIQVILAIYPNFPYKTYLNESLAVQKQWEERGYVISNFSEKTIRNAKWLIYDALYDESKLTIAYRSFQGDNNTIEIIIVNYGSLSESEIYNEIEAMLETSKKNDGSIVSGTANQNSNNSLNAGKA